MFHVPCCYTGFQHWIGILLVNAISQRIVLSGPLPLGQYMPFLICNRQASRPTPESSVFRYRGFFSSQNFINGLSLSVPLLFLKVLDMSCSTSILFLQMSTCIEASIFLMLPVNICLGNSLHPEMIVAPYTLAQVLVSACAVFLYKVVFHIWKKVSQRKGQWCI